MPKPITWRTCLTEWKSRRVQLNRPCKDQALMASIKLTLNTKQIPMQAMPEDLSTLFLPRWAYSNKPASPLAVILRAGVGSIDKMMMIIFTEKCLLCWGKCHHAKQSYIFSFKVPPQFQCRRQKGLNLKSLCSFLHPSNLMDRSLLCAFKQCLRRIRRTCRLRIDILYRLFCPCFSTIASCVVYKNIVVVVDFFVVFF